LFEPAVRRRAEQLAGFHHPNCATVRQIGRLPAPDGRLVIVPDAVDGWRLSEVLEAAGPCGVAFHADAVLFLLRQLLDADAVGPALRGWLRRVLSLTDELTAWSVVEARRELNHLVDDDSRYSFAPTGLPVILGAVAGCYAAAAEVPVPIHEPSGPPATTAEPARVPPPEPVQVLPPAPSSETSERQASPRLVPIVALKAEPVGQLPPTSDICNGSASVVAPLADTIAQEWPHAEAGGGRRHAHFPGGASSPRPFLGVDVAEDGCDPLPARSGRRTRTLVGIGAAAVVIVALGGCAFVRPSLVAATAMRLASAPRSTAAADEAAPAAVSAGGATSRADIQRAPSKPQAPEAQPPAAAPERPAGAGTIEVVSPYLEHRARGPWVPGRAGRRCQAVQASADRAGGA
jgi:hypothetical protein